MTGLGERIVVVGAPGAGKSTLARDLARHGDLVHVELDSIAHGPQWTAVPEEEFRNQLRARTSAGRWVCDGNYFAKSQWLWAEADTFVWLDQPLWLVVPRVARRSLRRILTREELWNGNRESWSALLGREGLVGWAVTSTRIQRRDLPAQWAELAAEGRSTFRLRTPADVRRWRARFLTRPPRPDAPLEESPR